MRQLNPLFFTFFLLATCLQAQEKPWQNIAEKDIPITGQRYISASNARTVRLNWDALEQVLAAAPLETSPTSRISSTYLDLPMPSGEMMRFRILASPIMEPGLAQKFPDIETYAGVAVDDEATFVRFDVTPQGFHAMILSPNFSTVYIDPYNFGGNRNDYLVYHRTDFVPLVPKEFNCYFQNAGDIDENRGRTPNPGWRFGDCRHRTYRLALAATGEYTTFHGGTVALAQAAQVTTMNRVNAILERELAIRLNIVANNNLLIYTNAATDPYTNGTPGTMINENQTNTTTVIGSANYDIGHVFGTNSGGLAGLGVVCVGPSKARGVTGSAAPVGDAFDVDYVAHEMGHQFGANHTFNNSCSGNRNTATAYETGSGSTIMSYAGICPPDVQNQVHDNYHAASLQEMGAFITGGGHTCPVTATLPNTAPVITSPSAAIRYNVPISTPFFLTATATDPNANTLTYSWEQMDNALSTQAPLATATSGPNFRVFAPSTSPTRYFPRLADLAAGITPTWEVLPSVARNINFRITVRDNAAGGGCTTHRDNVSVTFASTAGPFSVTNPSLTGITWAGATNQTVTWNVANTTAAPVSCPNVDILLSTDGGLTYPTVLATGVPNNGTAVVLAPSINTSTARVQIVCSNNIFFDISNNNFSITAATSDYTLSVNPPSASVCPPNTATYTVSVGSIGGFNTPVTLSTTGLAAGLTANFSPATVTPAGTAILTISGTGSVSPNTYNFNIQGSGSTGTKVINASLVITNPAPAAPTLTSPLNGATNVPTTPTFTWGAVAGVGISYDIQIATDALFGNIVSSATGLTTTTFIPSTALATNTAHFWRVRAINACGAGSFSPIFSFTTSNISCSVFNATNVPRTISASGINTALSTMTIPSLGGNIVDVDVINLAGTHSYFGDLRISVSSPSATSVRLVGAACTNTTNFNLNFDDGAGSGVIPCPPNTGGTFIPASLLAAFNGQNPAGVWTLRVLDSADVDGGSLNSWGLRVCVAPIACSITLTSTQTNVLCNGICTGVAVAVPAGATGAVTYVWSNASTGQTVNNLCAGVYTVTATDANACTATRSVTITQPTAIVAALAATPTNCTPNTGSIVSTVSGGTPGYAFAWSNSNTTANITGLAPNTYSVIITDANGCSVSQSATVANGCTVTPCSITLTSTQTNVLCNGVCTGVAVAVPAGNTGAVTYVWSNASTGQTVNNLCAGVYTVTATDANACTATRSVTITQPAAIVAALSATPTNCTPNTGSVVSTVSGGTPSYSFAWSNLNTTANITGLAPNTYSVIITDANGCSVSQSATVANGCTITPCSITLTSTQTNVLCNGVCSGLAAVSPAGAVGAVTYVWSNASTGQTVNNLCVGVYTVTATDANACTATRSVTITQPTAIVAALAATPTNCTPNTGSIVSTVSGGTPGYAFAWSNSNTTSNISGLAPNTYSVIITDANGCSVSQSATVANGCTVTPCSITLTSTQTNVLCNGVCSGLAAAVPAGAVGAVTYVWSNASTGQTVNNLCAGVYTVTATDANACTATRSVTITQPTAIAATLAATPTNCTPNTGSIVSTVSGGTPGYSFAWSNSNTTSNISGLAPNTYSVIITDANGCSVSQSATVANGCTVTPCSITLTATQNNVLCNGVCSGLAAVSPAGAVGAVTYVWSNASTGQTVNNLCAGVYTVSATDANACTATRSVTITQPAALFAALAATPTNCTPNTGSVVSTVSGGTPGYAFAWSNSNTTSNISGLAPNTYSVIITDANGCSVNQSATVANGCTVTPCSITLTSTQNNVLCNGVCTGVAAVSPAGNTGAVTYVWSNASTGQTVNNLCAGVYTVTATDANACAAIRSVTITQPAAIVAALATTPTNCTPNTGSIVSTVSGGTPGYSFAWSNSNTTSNISGLAPNTYSVIITDANGCSVSQSATVANGCTVTPCSITLTSTQTNVLCNGVCTGVAVAVPAGGTGAVTYVWSNASTGQTVNNLCAGVYTVTTTDANACTATRSVTITQPTAIVATLAATPTNCTPNTGSVVSTVSGGTPGYSFAWSNSNTTANITGLTPNTYNVIITDANGCSVSRTATVANGCTVTPCSITLTSTQTNVLCNGVCSGLAVAVPAGAIGAVTYVWSNASTGQTVNNLCAGVYTVSATDANACTATRSVTITQPAAIAATLSAIPTNCTPNTGSIVSTVSGGTPGYSFAWSNSNTTSNISGLTPNAYTAIITDANGCSVSRTATVANGCTVTPVSCIGTQSVSVTVGNPNCNGVCNGFAFAIPSGFSGNIASYNWSNGRSGQTIANLCAGVYTVTVTDVNGCVATASNSITQPTAITITGSITNPSCANGADGAISVNVTGGTAGYTFAWSNSRTSQNISALTGGNYSVIVTDANSCSVSSSPFILNNPSQLVATAAISPTSCSIGGSANAVVAGGTAPYSYLWDNGQSTQVSTGLTSGAHLVTITDNNGCRLIYTVAIPNGCVCGIVVTNTITQASCTNTCDGAIQIGLTNANGQIRYTWNNGRTSQNVSGLCPNTYIVTVTDANNCTATVNNLVINNPAPISSVISTTNASCNGTDGRATISLTGGTNPYTFNWSNGQQSSTASGLNAGVYPITATDANGCSVVRSATVGLSNSLAVTNPVVVQNASCFGVANGAAFISAAGANNISYLWSNGEATSSASALPGGISTITVSSAGGCIATRTVTISSPSQIVLNLISTQLNCVPNTGAIAAIVSGGSGSGYQFAWANGTSGTSISGLSSGQYSLTVTDGNNCSSVSTTNISIASPPLVVLTHTNPTCNTLADITATISPAGNYTFLWSNGSTTQNLSGIAGGIYQLEVRSGNCATTVRDTVPAAPPIDINFSVTLPTNPQTQDGSLSATASNGTAPFSYVWNTGATGSVLVGIGSGLYIVSVSDASGCTAIDSFQLGSITNITESENNIAFVIQPNPSAGEFNVILQSAIVGEYQIRLYDVLGRTLWQQEMSSPQLILPIDMSHLPAACYFVSVQQQGKISTQKLIIAK